MKIAHKLFLIALGSIAIFSCTNELADPEQNHDSLLPSVFTAVKEGTPIPSSPAAKSALNSDATAVLWTSDDKISIFGKTGTHSIFSVMSITETTAKFGGEAEAEGPYYAVTPYNAANALSADNKLKVVVPSVQTPLAACGNVDPAALVAVGKADENNRIYFYNVCGMLAFNVEDETVSEIRLEGAEGNNLAGEAIVDYSDNPSVVSVTDASSLITIKPEGDTFSKGTYYVSVLPVTLNGLTVTISKGEDKTVVYEVSNNIEVKRSVVRNVLNSTENEYEYNGYITDAASLNKFLAKASASTEDSPVKGVILNDIDLSNATITGATVLYGQLDGRGHSIKNWANNAGTLIAENNGTVKNITIDASCTLTAPSALTAADFGVLITKQGDTGKCIGCKNYADISVTPTSMSTVWRFAPLIGHNDEGYIEGCENHGDVTITLTFAQNKNLVVGGVVGYCKGDREVGKAVAKNCKNFGNIVIEAESTVQQNSIGGVVGMTPVHSSYKDASNPSQFVNTGLFTGCVNSGDITYTVGTNGSGSYTNMGGVIGYCEGDMESCSNSGKITLENSTADPETACTRLAVGGVAGCVGYSMRNCSNSGKVVFTGYAANGTAAATNAGGYAKPAFGGVVGIIGDAADVTGSVLQNCDNEGQVEITCHMVAGHSAEPLFGGVAGYARVAVSDCDNMSNGTVTVSTSGYYNCVGGVVGRVWGNNTMTNCSNAATLNVSTFGNEEKHAGNIVAGGVVGRAQVETGNCSNSGALNVTVASNSNSPAINFGGIIGHTRGPVSNKCANEGKLTLDVLSGTGTSYVGGVVGVVHDDATNGVISGDCSNSGALLVSNPTGVLYTGGVVGYSKFKIEKGVNSGDITVNFNKSAQNGFNYIGGITGRGKGGIENCKNSGNIAVTNKKVRLGGLAGFSDSPIKDCNVIESTLTTNALSASSQIGGFAGFCVKNISGGGFSGSIVNNSTNATYTGGLVGGLSAIYAPTIAGVSMNISMISAQENSGVIYGGQAEGAATDNTITMGTKEEPIKILNGSTFRGSLITESTTLFGTLISSGTTKSTLVWNIEFVNAIPTENGASNSSFQQGTTWNGTWN